jgi:hypothetical protein
MTLRSALPVYWKKGCTRIRRRLTVISLTLAFLIWPASSIGQESNSQPQEVMAKSSKKVDSNRKIYYRNKLEFSFESAYYPFNTGAIFDGITTPYPLHYTLVRLASMSNWVSQSSREVGRARRWLRQPGWIPCQYPNPSAGLVFRFG